MRRPFDRTMPARRPAFARASRNSTPSIFITKVNTSPPMSHTQHLNDCRSGLTWRLGRRVVVPGAKADVVAALAAQRNMAADQIDDVDRLLDPLFGVERAAGHRLLLRGHAGEIHFAQKMSERNRHPATNPFVVPSRKKPKVSDSGAIIAQRQNLLNCAEVQSQEQIRRKKRTRETTRITKTSYTPPVCLLTCAARCPTD